MKARVNIGGCLLFVCLATAAILARADGYPSRPIKFITSSAPGGAPDLRARVYAQHLSESLGQPIVVENRPGASGMIAAEAVIKAAPDGYTILFGSTQEIVFPAVLSALARYDPLRDFTPIVLASMGYALLMVHPSLGVKSLPELITAAKAKPGQIRCGTAGHASTNHMGCAYFSKLAGISIEMVPYKGAAPALLDASTGQVQLIIGFLAESQAYIKAGKLLPLAVLGPARLSQLPEVATTAQLGYQELQIQGWTCLMAPARTPPEIVRRLNAETIKAGTRADMSEWLEKTGAIFIAYTPEAFGEFVRAQVEKWRRISAETGIKAE